LLVSATLAGLLWGALVAWWFGAPIADGANLGLALFCPALVLATRPLAASAADTVVQR
jgi:hypothetical protein